ncbi:hypothetical protein BZG02_12975 [Labilibaculum filiforme]|uniref:Uncharacterized protein n=2 Tax=Labilibaculum filiforme TaxID=1940526 RepID=A0A2N3HVY1_9BACT|nr:hypothetical protein BZG02_12975 [Labilibaculum filiforme]
MTILLLFVVIGAKSQTISEKLGAVVSNFEITSATQPIELTNQIILKQNVTKHYDKDDDNEYAYYERYFLQFISKSKLIETKRSAIRKEVLLRSNLDFHLYDYFVTLFDEKGGVIHEFTCERKGGFTRDFYSDTVGYYAYSVELKGFPLILLDEVKRIDIQIID